MPNVYIVSEGSYSDYVIRGVFSTEENAKVYQARMGCDEITLFVLDEGIDLMRMGLRPFCLYMYRDGESMSVRPDGDWKTDVSFGKTATNREWMCLRLVAKNTGRAVKIANDKRCQIIALELWGNRDKVIEQGIVKVRANADKA